MKVLQFIVVLALLAGCSSQKNLTVDSGVNQDANFEEYRTYAWATSAADESNLKYSNNDPVLKDQIKSAIEYEMEARGYRMDENNPDLLLNFRVFEEDTEFTGFSGANQDEDYWGMGVQSGGVRPQDDARIFNLEKGTLFVSLVDKANSTLVWQGFVSGVLDDDTSANTAQVREAVNTVFSEFGYSASADGTNNTGRNQGTPGGFNTGGANADDAGENESSPGTTGTGY